MEGCYELYGDWFFDHKGFQLGPYPTQDLAEHDRQELLSKDWAACKTGNCED